MAVSHGCPDCIAGEAARAAVLGPEFWPSLLAVASPLLIVAIICALLFRIGKGRVA